MNRQQTIETRLRSIGSLILRILKLAVQSLLRLRMEQIWEMYKWNAIAFFAKTTLKSFLY
jgi:hypothetical protein